MSFPHFDVPCEWAGKHREWLVRTPYGGGLMRIVNRMFPLAALALCLGAPRLSAQEPGNGNFQWYIGGQGGLLVFRTPSQTPGSIPMAGGHVLVVAKRTGLMISVDEAFGSDELSSYTDGNGSVQQVRFNDIRKYSATLMAFPFRMPIQPYFGAGVGIMHVVHPVAANEISSEVAHELGSTGFGSFVGGVQLRLARFIAFGQYQITTIPAVDAIPDQTGGFAVGRLLAGPTHTFSVGLRIGLGGARDRQASGGY
jgi:hypothetical protein